MREWSRILLLSLLAGQLAPPAAALEVPLEYVRYPDEEDVDGPFVVYGEAHLEGSGTLPAGDWKLPELKSEQPLYLLAALGDGEVLLVLDRERADDPFFSRLLCDANANRDLTDDPAVAVGGGLPLPGLFETAPIDLRLSAAGGTMPYSFRFVAWSEEMLEGGELGDDVKPEELTFLLKSNCCYLGRFEEGQQTYRILLGDANANGRFDDTASFLRLTEENAHHALKLEGDRFFLTSDEEIGEHDATVLGSRVTLGGRVFDLAVDAVSSKLTLTPNTGALATLQLPVELERLTLETQESGEFVMLYRPGREAKVPPGSYRVAGYQLYRQDDQGDLWCLWGSATRQTAFVEVDPAQVTTLEFGEPFLSVGAVPEKTYQASKPLERVPVEFHIEGVARELVTELKHVSGDRTRTPLDETRSRPLEPTYIILMGSQIVARGAFEYG
ncbi:MAG: hypothetical protein V2A76_17390 [Planctomycetota bacterium]